MGRNYSTAIAVCLSCSILSCAFDPKEPTLYKLGGNYYASIDSNALNDGVSIIYTKDNVLFQIVALNCQSIYTDSVNVFYSISLVKRDTINVKFFKINAIYEKDVEEVDATSFEKAVKNLSKVKLSPPSL